MLIGYSRVSTGEQDVAHQEGPLQNAGCERIFSDPSVSGTVDPLDRAGFSTALDHARAGDTIVVVALDRVARSTLALLRLVEVLQERGVQLRSLRESISTEGPVGALLITVLAAIAQFERDLIQARTRAAVESRRAAGLPVGRPAALSAEQVELARRLVREGSSRATVARQLQVSKATIVRCTIGIGQEA